jgi:hypothetical protein
MKTTDYLRQYFPVFTIAGILITSASVSEAQNHRKNDREKDRDHKEYRYSDRDKHQTSEYKWKGKDRDWDDRYSERNDDRREYHPKYTNRKHNYKPDYFDHPRYGRVYHNMDQRHVVYRHKHGDYYFLGDHFYRYHKGIGYCVVEPPRGIYFSHLPVACDRVRIDGHVFFRHGDLYFQLSPRGYVLVPSPLEIRFSARF